MALNVLYGAVHRQIAQDAAADLQRLIDKGNRERESVDQPIAEVRDVRVAAAVKEHILFVARIPMGERADEAAETIGRQARAILRVEYADSVLCILDCGLQLIVDQIAKEAIADADDEEVHARRRWRPRTERAPGEL